ncbi:MAG: RidA family protein [Acidobacteriota bacterium]|nr:RidA family protein [Acidobacteriota bacterium]MDH3786686.1 RidA family protein [Acidobacteriota bacterium]
MSRTVIKTDRAPGAVGPYSQAILADGWLWCSGQIPLDPATGQMVDGEIGEQTRQVLLNLKGLLEAGGAGLDDVVKVNVYLVDMDDFDAVNRVYGEFFKEDPPARACVDVCRLPKGARVEMDAVARIGAVRVGDEAS